MSLQSLESLKDLEDVLALPRILIYKHSSMCWSSMVAYKHVSTFSLDRPELPVFMVDVITRRNVSNRHCGQIKRATRITSGYPA